MIKTATCAVLAVCLLAPVTYGQAQFLDKGESGFGIAAGYSVNDDVDGMGIQLGYAPSNMYDVGVGLTRVSIPRDKSFVISPFLDIWFLNENNGGVPLSVGLVGQFDMALSTDSRVSNWAYLAGMLFQKNLAFTEKTKLQPYAGAGIYNAENYPDNRATAIYLAGVSLSTRAHEKNVLMFGLGFTSTGSEAGWTTSLSIGYIFGSGYRISDTPSWKD